MSTINIEYDNCLWGWKYDKSRKNALGFARGKKIKSKIHFSRKMQFFCLWILFYLWTLFILWILFVYTLVYGHAIGCHAIGCHAIGCHAIGRCFFFLAESLESTIYKGFAPCCKSCGNARKTTRKRHFLIFVISTSRKPFIYWGLRRFCRMILNTNGSTFLIQVIFGLFLGLFALSRKGSYLSLGIRPVPHYLFHPLSRREYLIDEITPGIK